MVASTSGRALILRVGSLLGVEPGTKGNTDEPDRVDRRDLFCVISPSASAGASASASASASAIPGPGPSATNDQ